MTLKKELVLPLVTIVQRVAFGILVSMEVYKTASYTEWALNWLSGKDRTNTSANAANATYAANAATYAAAYAANAATYAAAYAANAAANAGLSLKMLIKLAKKAWTYS